MTFIKETAGATVDIPSNLNVSGILDITDTTEANNFSGDSGAFRLEGGGSIAKSLYVGMNLYVEGNSNLDNTDIDGTFTMDGTSLDINATTTCEIDNSNTGNGVKIGTNTSSGKVTIGHTTSETIIADNLVVKGTLSIGDGTGDGPATFTEVTDGGGGTSRKMTIGNFEIDYDGSTNSNGFITFKAGSSGTDREWYLQQRKDGGNEGDFWIEYKNTSGGGTWFQPVKIDASSGDNALVLGVNGNIGLSTATFDGSVQKYLTLTNGTEPSAHTDNQIYIGAKDASTTSESTLALFCEEDPVAHDAGGAYTNSHKMKIWLNGTEYWIVLDAV